MYFPLILGGIPVKNFLIKAIRDRDALLSLVGNLAYWLFTTLYFELLTQLVGFGVPDGQIGFVFGFSLSFAAVLALVTAFLPRKVHFPVTLILTVLCLLLYGSQLVYHFVFGTFYSVSQMKMGGTAITSFWRETLLTMWRNLPWLLVMFVPVILLCLLRKWKKQLFRPSNPLWCLLLVAVLLVSFYITVACIPLGGTGAYSNYDFYYSATTTTDQAIQHFGLLTAFRLDIFHEDIVPGEEEEDDPYYTPEPPPTKPPAPTAPADPSAPTVETEPPVEYNVLEFDFDQLNTLTEDNKIIAINNYCKSLAGTQKNEYTGLLSDYNLIVLCAESFSAAALHPELTPTLYRMANEGIVFKNYYNTYPNNTSDGEYTLCTGLYPDTTRGKEDSTFYASRNSYLPYCLGNMFHQQRDIQAYGYHNYMGFYYGRDESHPNMGYSMKFARDGMTFSTTWPSSDLEMMEQSIEDYIHQEQFHAYYMTFSGHLAYDKSVNPMAVRNWDLVKDLPYSNAARCYLSCNMELEKAMTYLLQRLEEEGVADKTAIVLAGDHYPYGLTGKQYAELLDYEIDHFSRAKSPLIFWVGGLEENIVVEEYCCNADILPTILNLWGFDYDSRILAGTDVFSDGTHMAVLTDKSFLTDKVWLDGRNGKVRYLVDESQIPEGYVDSLIKLVKTKFTLSADILNTAYYNFLFEKGDVTLDRGHWRDPVPETTDPPEPQPSEPSEPSEPPESQPPEPSEPSEPPESQPPEPSESQPSEPLPSEPAESQPAETEPEASEPAGSQPVSSEPQ